MPDVAHIKDANSVFGVDNPEGISVPDHAASMDGDLAEVIIGLWIHQESMTIFLSLAVNKCDTHTRIPIVMPAGNPAIGTIVSALSSGVGRR